MKYLNNKLVPFTDLLDRILAGRETREIKYKRIPVTGESEVHQVRVYTTGEQYGREECEAHRLDELLGEPA